VTIAPSDLGRVRGSKPARSGRHGLAQPRAAQPQALAAGDLLPPADDASAARWIDWAQATGRIAAASRSTWARNWTASPVATRATLSILARVQPTSTGLAASAAPSTLPAPARTAASQTASGLDVSTLPSRLQPVAAAEPDRGTVWSWVDRYAGMADHELDVAMLQMEGQPQLAAGMVREDNRRRVESVAAAEAEGRAAWRAHAEAMGVSAEEERQTMARAVSAERANRGEGRR